MMHRHVVGERARCGNARPWRESPASISRKPRGPDGEHRRQADRPNPSNSARRPSPRSRTCCRGAMPNLRRPRRRWSTPRRNAARSRLVLQRVERPAPREVRVGQRLQRGERLRADDEQRFGRRRGRASPRRNRCGRRWRRSGTSCRAARSRAAPRRPSPGPRSEPPMPMLTTLRMRLPVAPSHRAAAHGVGECRHVVEHRVHFRHHVDAVDDQARASRRAQRRVQHRAALGRVDVLAARTWRGCARRGRSRRPAASAGRASRR